jgi:hypothetical protein
LCGSNPTRSAFSTRRNRLLRGSSILARREVAAAFDCPSDRGSSSSARGLTLLPETPA